MGLLTMSEPRSNGGGDAVYEVEAIREHSTSKSGKVSVSVCGRPLRTAEPPLIEFLLQIVQYLVKWKGYGEDESTWEDVENCHSCPLAIYEYHVKKNIPVPPKIQNQVKPLLPQAQGTPQKKRKRSPSPEPNSE